MIAHKVTGRVIGYVIYWLLKGEAQISNLAVHPDFRRQGIAESVLYEILDRLEKQNAEIVILEVRPSNVAALSLPVSDRKCDTPDGN